jgi:hypothetical protein
VVHQSLSLTYDSRANVAVISVQYLAGLQENENLRWKKKEKQKSLHVSVLHREGNPCNSTSRHTTMSPSTQEFVMR